MVVQSKPSLRSRVWSKVSSADTWSWLYGWVPKPVRAWLKDNVWGPALAALTTLVTWLLGWVSHFHPWHIAIGCLVVAAASIYIGSWLQRSVASLQARSQPFKLTPFSGSNSSFSFESGTVEPGAPLVSPEILLATLEVESKQRFLRNCTATVTDVYWVIPSSRTLQRMKGDPKDICWTPAKDGLKSRDLAPGVPRRLDVGHLDQEHPDHWTLMAADQPRPQYPHGWYKVVIRVASESDDRAVQVYEGKIALGRRVYPPPPLVFYPWEDGDEKRVKFDD